MSANPQNSQPPKLLDQLRGKTRLLHYSKRTEDAYADWATKFILFHGKRHPREMGTTEVAAYLTYLALLEVRPAGNSSCISCISGMEISPPCSLRGDSQCGARAGAGRWPERALPANVKYERGARAGAGRFEASVPSAEQPMISFKQLKFAEGVIAGKSATAAYVAAGYSGRGHAAASGASRMLRNGEVSSFIDKAHEAGLKNAEISAQAIISTLGEIGLDGRAPLLEPDGTHSHKPVGSGQRLRAIELLGRYLKLWTRGASPQKAESSPDYDYSRLTDDELVHLEALLAKATKDGS